MTEISETAPVETDADLIRLLFVTNSGAVRAHSVTASEFASARNTGEPISELVHSYNALGHRRKDGHFNAAGELRLRPDPDTLCQLPYAERAAGVLCDVATADGEPWAADARSSLAAVVSQLRAAGLGPTAAFESEFHLYEQIDEGDPERVDTRGAYLTSSTRATHETVLGVIDALEAQDIPVKKYYPEYAAGKHEFVTGHREGVRAADDHVLLRETVDSVARQEGYRATGLPYPFDGATNGCHIHVSLWDDGNRFYDRRDGGLSDVGESFVAGVLDHAPALTALTAPTANSYARLRPQHGAAAYVCWGPGNREALVRVPLPDPDDPEGSTRIEYRAADNTCNPYLALLGLLVAGRDGIERDLEPPEPLRTDPATLSETERDEGSVERLPRTLGEALEELAADQVLRDGLGEALVESYLSVKRSHWAEFTRSAGSWRRDHLRELF